MYKARISCPDKNAMQSGKAKGSWLLEFEPSTAYFSEGLMGWTGMRDTVREVRLSFPSKEAAIEYAKSQNLSYEVFEPKPRTQLRKAYADNFKFKK